MTSPPDAWALRRLLTGHDLNGELDTLPTPLKEMGEYLAGLDKKARPTAWQAMMAARPDRDELIKALADVDPLGPAPQVQTARFATAADVRRIMTSIRWLWEGWIPASRVVGIASLEGTGKTRFGLDLCRRVWNGMPWPDGQAMTLPAKTPSLWLCADGHHDEIVDILPMFNLPDEAVIFPSPPDDPYNNTSLDAPETLAQLDAAIVARKPWALLIDSLTYATSRDLCEQRSIAILKTPLVDLVQRHQVNVMLFLHVSREGQALGRRIRGITRTLLHLECPDPEQSHRLRLWVEKTYGKKPPALGVTMGDSGSTYDFNPPARLEPDRGGRKPVERDKAMQFIRDALTRQNDQIGNDLRAEWVKDGGSESTFWRGVDAMKDAGDLTTDGGKGTGKQTVLHLIDNKTSQAPQTSPNRA